MVDSLYSLCQIENSILKESSSLLKVQIERIHVVESEYMASMSDLRIQLVKSEKKSKRRRNAMIWTFVAGAITGAIIVK